MPLINKFTETIFLKEDSELQKKVDALRTIKDKVSPKCKEKFEQDLRFSEYGLIGEDRIAYELKNATLGMYVIRDLNVEYEGQSAQIDYAIFTRSNCYLVECKNMIGTITVNQEGEFRREYTWRNKKQKEAIYSPYRQALRHKEILKRIWLDKSNTLSRMFGEKVFEEYYKPLVVMANPNGLLNIKYAPIEIKNITIRVDQLVDYLKKDLNAFDEKTDVIDKILNTNFEKKDDIKSFADGLFKYHKKVFIDYTKGYELVNNDSKEIKETKKDKVVKEAKENSNTQLNSHNEKNQKANSDDELRNKLIAFRTEMARANKVPPYYVFKNDELEELITNKPKTSTEIEKILPQVKCKKYGRQIVKIINEYILKN